MINIKDKPNKIEIRGWNLIIYTLFFIIKLKKKHKNKIKIYSTFFVYLQNLCFFLHLLLEYLRKFSTTKIKKNIH